MILVWLCGLIFLGLLGAIVTTLVLAVTSTKTTPVVATARSRPQDDRKTPGKKGCGCKSRLKL